VWCSETTGSTAADSTRRLHHAVSGGGSRAKSETSLSIRWCESIGNRFAGVAETEDPRRDSQFLGALTIIKRPCNAIGRNNEATTMWARYFPKRFPTRPHYSDETLKGGNLLHGTTRPYPLANRRLKREWNPTCQVYLPRSGKPRPCTLCKGGDH
jgi:hypothetical protein